MWGISGAELVVLLVVVLVVAGPERLPEFAAQLGRLTREFKRVASGARERVRDEFGEEFDSIDFTMFDPRQYDPRRIVRDALLEDEPVARPRPRADRRGVTAPSSPVGSHQVGAQPAVAATTAAAAADAVALAAAGAAATSAPLAAPAESESPARSSATAAPGAAPRPPAPPAGAGAAQSQGHPGPGLTPPEQPGARVLSPKEIVARTRGVRPAYESPAVVAALGAVGLTPEEIRAAGQDAASEGATSKSEGAVPAETSVHAPPGAAEPADPKNYVVPFDDEAT